MANRSLPHDSSACPLCDDVPFDAYRRHWKHEAKASVWHLIADVPTLMARLARQAHFVTILSYRPGSDGSTAYYRGPMYGEFDADDPDQAFTELRRCLQVLDVEYGCPLEAIRVWHSGRHGPHWTIPPVVIGAEAGHP
jgi:hypothetical protein